jgi:hypothetical protein
VSLSRREREIKQARAPNTVAVGWRPSRAPGGHGACKRGQRRGEIGPGQGKSDAWKLTRQEVERQRQHSSGGKVLCTGGRGGRGAEGCQRKKKEGDPRDLRAKPKESRDLSVKQNFLLI